MGSFDVTVKKYTQMLIVPIVMLGLIWYKRKPLLRYIHIMHKVGYAWILNRLGKSYNKKMGKKKQKLFAELHDLKIKSQEEPFKILEIGAGSGTNFKYYPDGVYITCVDPNPYFESYLKKNASDFPHVVLDQFVVCGAESMSTVPSESIDAVVCTLVMCTVNDMVATLSEIRRVLKKGGKFFYMEHVAANEGTFLLKAQKLFHPVWKIVGDNCHLARSTGKLINQAGFTNVDHEHFNASLKFPLISPHLAGIATK